MDPAFRLYSALHQYQDQLISLHQLQELLVPLLPHFTEQRAGNPAAQVALDVDDLILEIGNNEATEDDLIEYVKRERRSLFGARGEHQGDQDCQADEEDADDHRGAGREHLLQGHARATAGNGRRRTSTR